MNGARCLKIQFNNWYKEYKKNLKYNFAKSEKHFRLFITKIINTIS